MSNTVRCGRLLRGHKSGIAARTLKIGNNVFYYRFSIMTSKTCDQKVFFFYFASTKTEN